MSKKKKARRRLSEQDWQAVRAEYENSAASLRKLGKKYGIDATAISRRAKSEKWQRGGSAPTEADKKLMEKIADAEFSDVSERESVIDNIATKRADVFRQHQQDWHKVRQILSDALAGISPENINGLKKCAEIFQIIQSCERQAWGMPDFARLAESEREASVKNNIIRRFMDNEIDAFQAGGEFELNGLPMPAFVKIALSRMTVPESVPEEAEPISASILKARFEATQKKIEDQRAALPARREEIKELKKQVEVDSKQGQMGTAQGVEKGPATIH